MKRELPPFHPNTTNSTNVYQYTYIEDAFLDQGVDSQVYRFGNWILHKFDRNIPFAKIKLLQEVTQEVSRLAPRYGKNIGPKWGQTVLRCVPITKILETPEHRQAFAIEPYIGGYRYKQGANSILDQFLEDVSTEMRRLTGRKGIGVLAPNTKILKTNHGIGPLTRSTTTITDICQYVTELE